MQIASLSTYSREQLSDILRILKLYKTGLVQIGHRAQLQDPKENKGPHIRVEYPTGSSLDEIRSFSLESISQYFGIKKVPDDVVFSEKFSLIGGIRIFVWDDMLDVSFRKFANQMKV